MKLPRDQLVALSSAEMVQNYLDAQRSRISDSVKQSLAVAEIYKQENLKISDEELDMEVNSAIEEFKRYDQEYDDARVREQVIELISLIPHVFIRPRLLKHPESMFWVEIEMRSL